jgi:hypothetical protein
MIEVPVDASREVLEEKHNEVQRELERVRDLANAWFTLSEAEQQRQRAIWTA